jgi:hypothetical protein
MTIGIYDTATLIEVVSNLKRPQNWLLNTFFPNVITFDTEEVDIDVDIGLRRMAPFVSPLMEGKIVESRRYQTNRFKPAYVKPKTALDVRKPLKRMIGERIGGGGLTPAEREMANLQAEMQEHVDQIDRRLEWMASTALVNGTVTITGEGYPTVVVDFGRDSTLTVALSGASRWGQSGIVPSDNVTTWCTTVLQKSGAIVTDAVFTPASWAKWKLDDAVKNSAIIYSNLNPNGNVVDPGTQVQLGAMLMGRWGQLNLWLYNDWYIDDAGAEQPMIPDGTVILASRQLQGTQAFGAILDPEIGYMPMMYAPKSWVTKDPAQRLVMTQSAPIVIPSRANAALAATVI